MSSGLGLGYGSGIVLGGLRTVGLSPITVAPVAVAPNIAFGGVRNVGLNILGGSGVSRIAGSGGMALVGRAVATESVGPVVAAIETRRSSQVVDVPTSRDLITPQTLIVEPSLQPVNIEFRSSASPINVNQVYIPGRPGEVQATRSEDEPDRHLHEIVKPVIQEVRETVVPYRRVTQEILPIQEEINSILARGQQQQVIAQPAVTTVGVEPAVAAVGVQPAVAAVGVQPAVAAVGVQPVVAAVGVQPTVAAFGIRPAFAVVPALQTIGVQPVATGLVGTGILNGELIYNGLINGGLIGTQVIGAPLQTINTRITRIGSGITGGQIVNGRIIDGGVVGTRIV